MKRVSFLLAVVALPLVLLSSACEPGEVPGLAQLPATTEEAPSAGPAVTAGPRAWIENPQEGETLPAGEPVTFVAYATDAQGVDRIELRVNDQSLPIVQGASASPDGSFHLLRLEQEWKPDKEGEYMVEARGRNTASSYGEPAYVRFCYGSCEKKELTPTPAPFVIPTEMPVPSIIIDTPTPAPFIITETPAPAAQYDLYVRRMDFSPANPLVGETIRLFIMIATDTYPPQGPYFPASYFRWRQGAGFPWHEEACPPNNQYASCTKTVEFSYDRPGSYKVEVEADSGQAVAEADETNNARAWTITVGQPTPTNTPKLPTPTFTPQPPTPTFTPQPEDVRFWADNENISAGSCTMVRWHVSNVRAYWVDGNPGAGDDGSFQTCPCQDETHNLHVVKQDGSEKDFYVTIRVSGQCGPPPTEAPPPQPPPPQDTTGPSFSGLWIRWGDCQLYGQAGVSDPSGVAWAQFHFNLNGEGWRSVWMKDIGSGTYETEVGIAVDTMGTPVGTIEYYVVAGDNIGNQSESGHDSYSYMGCGGGGGEY